MFKQKLKKIVDFITDFSDFLYEQKFYSGRSFAQNYEDLVIKKIIDDSGTKTISKIYVDIGAHDPIRFSNTYNLYKKGWKGINIDPLPSCIDRFNKYRKRDINLNIGISSKKGEIEYYNFKEPAYNTLNPERAKLVIENQYTKLIEKKTIQVDTLNNVLDKYLTKEFDESLQIGLLTLDVETMEVDVLNSNEWDKYRPQFIIMESIVNVNESLDNIYQDRAVRFLIEKKYIAVAKVGNAVFFRDSIR